jgi:hypothetical protein
MQRTLVDQAEASLSARDTISKTALNELYYSVCYRGSGYIPREDPGHISKDLARLITLLG